MRRALTVAIVLLSATAAGAETLDLQKLLPEGGTAARAGSSSSSCS